MATAAESELRLQLMTEHKLQPAWWQMQLNLNSVLFLEQGCIASQADVRRGDAEASCKVTLGLADSLFSLPCKLRRCQPVLELPLAVSEVVLKCWRGQ